MYKVLERLAVICSMVGQYLTLLQIKEDCIKLKVPFTSSKFHKRTFLHISKWHFYNFLWAGIFPEHKTDKIVKWKQFHHWFNFPCTGALRSMTPALQYLISYQDKLIPSILQSEVVIKHWYCKKYSWAYHYMSHNARLQQSWILMQKYLSFPSAGIIS